MVEIYIHDDVDVSFFTTEIWGAIYDLSVFTKMADDLDFSVLEAEKTVDPLNTNAATIKVELRFNGLDDIETIVVGRYARSLERKDLSFGLHGNSLMIVHLYEESGRS